MLFKNQSPQKPRIHFSNWGQVKKVPKEDIYSIMTWTPSWAPSQQTIPSLVPEEGILVAYKTNRISLQEYRKLYLNNLIGQASLFTPLTMLDSNNFLVPEDAYLCCSCSIATAEKGACHRSWAASFLQEMGWSVTLDKRFL